MIFDMSEGNPKFRGPLNLGHAAGPGQRAGAVVVDGVSDRQVKIHGTQMENPHRIRAKVRPDSFDQKRVT